MIPFISGIILKDKIVLEKSVDDEFSDILKRIKIEDTIENQLSKFVKVQLISKSNRDSFNYNNWIYYIRQKSIPDWYKENPKKYEDMFRESVKKSFKDNIIIAVNSAWIKFKEDKKGLYYLYDDVIPHKNRKEFSFEMDNNYAKSSMRTFLNEPDRLLKYLKEEFGDRLVPVTLDLLSLDGYNDYGIVEGDYLGLLTLDLYRKYRKNIPNVHADWWLVTPARTSNNPAICQTASLNYYGDTRLSLYVDKYGFINFTEPDLPCSLRPFFIIKK